VYVSQILATGICAIFTYILFKTFAFRRNSWHLKLFLNLIKALTKQL
jgi:hypothetical protein